jgi:sensor histidine kinase YesM
MIVLYIILVILYVWLVIYYPFSLIFNIDYRKKKRLQYSLFAFQSHTNPHFIKNVLQAINWFILNNEKELASDYLCDFARLMEDILKFSKKIL